MGELVQVNGHQISIYPEGQGDNTIIFLSGSGATSPILDFITLANHLKDRFKIVIIEKDGCGFSDIYQSSRDIETIN